MFTIPRIEGNSKIGAPLFSVQGLRDNFKYMCFQTSYEENKEIAERNRQETDLQAQVKLYKGFQELQPEMGEKLHERLKEVLKVNSN